MSKDEEAGGRPPTLQTGYPSNGRKAILDITRLQGVEG
jgi:hypothetical protein